MHIGVFIVVESHVDLSFCVYAYSLAFVIAEGNHTEVLTVSAGLRLDVVYVVFSHGQTVESEVAACLAVYGVGARPAGVVLGIAKLGVEAHVQAYAAHIACGYWGVGCLEVDYTALVHFVYEGIVAPCACASLCDCGIRGVVCELHADGLGGDAVGVVVPWVCSVGGVIFYPAVVAVFWG